MTIKQTLNWAREQLKDVCERPQYEAELLLAYVLKKDRTYLILHNNDTVDIKEYEKLITRRKNQGVPVRLKMKAEGVVVLEYQ